MSNKRVIKTIICIVCFLVVFSFISIPCADAQTWTALPPYNFLWPLWSPALSPVDSVTGLKTPIVSSLYPSTVLPIQPGLVWNPIFSNPYFLYNSPVGLQYYDTVYGINPWPPSYSLDPVTGSAIPLNLPVGYQYLPPTDSVWLEENLPLANLAYLSQYPTWALAAYSSGLPANLTGLDPWLASLYYPTPAFSSLLTTAQLLGYAPVTSAQFIAPSTAVPIPPTAITPLNAVNLITTTTTTTITKPPLASTLFALTLLGLI